MGSWVSPARRPILTGIAIETALFAVALLLATWWGVDPLGHGRLASVSWLAGAFLTLPPLALLAATLRSRSSWAVRLVQTVDDLAEILSARATPLSLLLLAAAAGIAEETLFRGVIQAGVAARLGDVLAVVVASALFGALHAISPAYVVVATAMGLYLGVVFAITGNLIEPIVIHATYDYVALLVFRRRVRGRPRAPDPAAEGGKEL